MAQFPERSGIKPTERIDGEIRVGGAKIKKIIANEDPLTGRARKPIAFAEYVRQRAGPQIRIIKGYYHNLHVCKGAKVPLYHEQDVIAAEKAGLKIVTKAGEAIKKAKSLLGLGKKPTDEDRIVLDQPYAKVMAQVEKCMDVGELVDALEQEKLSPRPRKTVISAITTQLVKRAEEAGETIPEDLRQEIEFPEEDEEEAEEEEEDENVGPSLGD